MAHEKRSPSLLDLGVPDLDLPSPGSRPASTAQGPAEPATPRASSPAFDDGALELDRGLGVGRASPTLAAKRGPAASGLELSFDRVAAERAKARSEEPGAMTRIAATAVPAVALGAAATALLQLAHVPSGVSLMAAWPSAFDASSLAASLTMAAALSGAAVGLAAIALRRAPRSWALVAASLALLLSGLAMVTVALGATEETPMPADGALVVPWLVGAALALSAVSIFGRARRAFLTEGARSKLAAIALAATAGVLVYAAVEVTPLARFVSELGLSDAT